MELGGVAEMAAEFGVLQTTASMWNDPERRKTNGFPGPVARLAMGPVFDMEEVRAWYRSRHTNASARAGESQEVVESS